MTPLPCVSYGSYSNATCCLLRIFASNALLKEANEMSERYLKTPLLQLLGVTEKPQEEIVKLNDSGRDQSC
jgi:hypothetical protein